MSASANAKSHAVGKTLLQAELIRQVVQQHRFGHFKVPRKRPFLTPSHPSCAPDNQPMTLVAELRDLVPKKDNAHARRHSITHGRLDELYAIIESEEARATGRITFRSPGKVGLNRYRAFAPEARRAIAGIDHGVKFLSYFTPRTGHSRRKHSKRDHKVGLR
jgi:hypothetical protein